MTAEPCAACATPVPGEKPPPIVLAVGGLQPEAVTFGAPDQQAINWYRLLTLPPFQMFAVAKGYLTAQDITAICGQPSPQEAEAQRRFFERIGDAKRTFDEYCAWHQAKGYWPNETPMGEVKEP